MKADCLCMSFLKNIMQWSVNKKGPENKDISLRKELLTAGIL